MWDSNLEDGKTLTLTETLTVNSGVSVAMCVLSDSCIRLAGVLTANKGDRDGEGREVNALPGVQ